MHTRQAKNWTTRHSNNIDKICKQYMQKNGSQDMQTILTRYANKTCKKMVHKTCKTMLTRHACKTGKKNDHNTCKQETLHTSKQTCFWVSCQHFESLVNIFASLAGVDLEIGLLSTGCLVDKVSCLHVLCTDLV